MRPEGNVRQQVARWVVQTLLYLDAEPLIDHVRIEWRSRMRTTAGRARFRAHPKDPRAPGIVELHFNPRLFERMDHQERFETAVHETCHLVADYRNVRAGRRERAHGPTWQRLMRACDLEPKRTHRVDTTGLYRSRRHYRAGCACNTYSFGVQRARKAMRLLLRCKLCKHFVELNEASKRRLILHERRQLTEIIAQEARS